MSDSQNHHILDARRMLCPMPVIKTQNKIKTLQPGDFLEVTCTDPGAVSDIPAWCRVSGHRFIDYKQDGDEIIFNIEVGQN